MFCPECQTKYPADVRFCIHDGTALRAEDADATTTPGSQDARELHGTVDADVLAAVDDDDEDDTIFEQFPSDKYKVADLLGSGGMGQVYKARSIEHDCWVALKILSDKLAQDDVGRKRFLREAEVISQLRHPHTVRVLDHGELANGARYMAMEYIEGESLEVLIRQGPIQWERALGIVDKVCQSLNEAHRLNIFHRDIKPANIMFERRLDGVADHVKVLDFGIAKVESQSTELTHSNMLVGTPSYIAPEQAKGAEIDHRVDIYALGVTLFEMLTGERPFTGPAVHVLIFKHVHQPPPRIRDAYDYVAMPPELDDLLQCMMAKSPDERPTNMTALRSALAHVGNLPAEPARAEWNPTHNERNEEDTAIARRRIITPSVESSVEQRDTGDLQVWVPPDLINEIGTPTAMAAAQMRRRSMLRWLAVLGLLLLVAAAGIGTQLVGASSESPAPPSALAAPSPAQPAPGASPPDASPPPDAGPPDAGPPDAGPPDAAPTPDVHHQPPDAKIAPPKKPAHPRRPKRPRKSRRNFNRLHIPGE